MLSLETNFRENGISCDLVILPGYGHGGGNRERIEAAVNLFLKQMETGESAVFPG